MKNLTSLFEELIELEVMMRLRQIRKFSTKTRQRWTNAKIKKPVTLYRDNISFFS